MYLMMTWYTPASTNFSSLSTKFSGVVVILMPWSLQNLRAVATASICLMREVSFLGRLPENSTPEHTSVSSMSIVPSCKNSLMSLIFTFLPTVWKRCSTYRVKIFFCKNNQAGTPSGKTSSSISSV
eukprot:Lithocolla_globosa_v1_NODE_357_length_4326_cov_202.120815.p2 type:complete len:126 gc:universal NODE_357_length_4326_cov_202.120815:636-259(-)